MQLLNKTLFLTAVLSAGLLSGCLYTNIHAPWSYRSAAPSDVKAQGTDERVSGEACFYSVLYLVAWGDGGYAAAVDDALDEHPDTFLYDVRSDVKATSILFGTWARRCTIVTGRVGRP